MANAPDLVPAKRAAASRSLVIGLTCLAISTFGWLAILVVAWLWPGGHPPLAAYVSVPVILASLPIGLAGVVASGWSAGDRSGHPALRIGAMIGNGIVLLAALVHLTRS